MGNAIRAFIFAAFNLLIKNYQTVHMYWNKYNINKHIETISLYVYLNYDMRLIESIFQIYSKVEFHIIKFIIFLTHNLKHMT